MLNSILYYTDIFDRWVVQGLGELGQVSAFANRFIIGFLVLDSVKLLPVVAIIWFIWFRSKDNDRDKSAVICAFVSALLAVGVARLIQDFLPERPRPVHAGLDVYQWPTGIDHDVMEKWSSFPSDHASLSFAIATSIWMVSKRWGAVLYAWALFVVCFPRMFAGWHYASDVISGAVIGTLVAYQVMKRGRLLNFAKRWSFRFEQVYPGLFYACALIFSFEIVTMFDDVRKTAHEGMEWLLDKDD